MLLLTSTSDKVQVQTGAAGASVDVHVSWVDNASGTITLDDIETKVSQANSRVVSNEILPIHGYGKRYREIRRPTQEEVEAERIRLGIIEAKQEIKRVVRLINKAKTQPKQPESSHDELKLKLHAELLKQKIKRAQDEYDALLFRINKNYLRARVEAHKAIKRQQEESDISYVISMLALM